MKSNLKMTENARHTNEQAYNRALEVLLSAAGLARTQAILAEVIVEFRKRQPNNAHVTDDPESAFAFGPDLLARAREVEQGEVQR
ncbi:hypothetical protein [Burkholderia pseudomallei]|uniref:hypothetical protein n=1 Tax=Burkholderia pseudomallei TaxID=28450 RepID=UPI0011784D82|nr:hypothetical protein [Burkholderia pseudomallei]MBF3518089.1 hypothetical protein [Burkholderia pseudomallei]MBF4016300.1 hypothetical protein [Burkholderia pseudomallei]